MVGIWVPNHNLLGSPNLMFSARKAALAPLALSTVGLAAVALLVLNPVIAYGQSPLKTQPPATAAPRTA